MIASLIGGMILLLVWVIGGIISLAGFVFWLWMLVDAIKNRSLTDGEKVVWVLVIIFLPVLGSILYFFIGKPKGS